MTIAELLNELDTFTSRIPLEVLTKRLAELTLPLDSIQNLLLSSDESYRRNLFHEGPAYQALILYWLNGQRSPIHDHHGSSCGMKILRGVATETSFRRSPNGLVYAVQSFEIKEGEVTGSQDSDVHQISNLQAGTAKLISLHVYSPPLLSMGIYSLTEPGVERPVAPVSYAAME